ncbi:alpha-L-arabinofuranosidase C-terminal domain-containing protein [Streptomyces millisiae]|uniref:non-reducing end alpha-L-arabinofuranosidase n=1 Tax=Streptomyces millisiae TaxID=3075542 RepID=A0ABU2LSQ6_9ACTN|nr:alpha-L-arabinofuranosidase C-terminal domain-containing protein [Streptomyces sp. DSM 44918]MDT0320566.1 alpha-L-arabinofuranosidase C-terminal domain-containing protein [Streptomyces sp. DSM 44918]
MRGPRTLPATALILATAATLAAGALPGAGASAAPAPDYTITVDPRRAGPEISDTMYGVFLEDINFAADGGLYAELVRNRSFEFGPRDHASYTPLTAWSEVARGDATGSATVVDDAARLNETNRQYLRLDLAGGTEPGAGYGVRNAGFFTGMEITEGDSYDFSVWARTDQPQGTELTVTLDTAAGTPLAAELTRAVRGDTWTKYTGTLTATASAPDGGLTVTAAGGGTVRLDMVSLFPQDTFRGRENGLRRDLAERIAALEPGFLRFPGGCLVNTGSHEAYQAPNWPRERSYQWKETVGPVEERAVNHNFWGYNQSYGLGYFEYFQFAEDVGAMPLPVVPALVTGCGENRATDDPELLARHIQDTLDLVEFANGPADSPWGSVRAEMGHPEPFGLTHLAVGNEENLPEEYFENFLAFRAAIEAEYPEITVIGNSGPSAGGTTFDRLWDLNREADVAMVDEHYYMAPNWFLSNNERYDSYDRAGPDVFLGEYASRDNRFANALAEAAYMTGLERNADVVRLASYAPLLAHTQGTQWRPDLIWFDNDASWGSASYEVQRLFATNTGDRVVPSRATTTPGLGGDVDGAVGLATWATSAAYDDVTVTSADGETLLTDDFSGGLDQWSPSTGAGTWSLADGALVQADTTSTDNMLVAGDRDWVNYDLEVTATKRSGSEGFLIGFGVQGTGDYYWWNLGGWGNTRSAVEQAVGGAKSELVSDGTTIETGRAYDIRVQVRGREVTLFLDGEEWGSFTEPTPEPFRQVVTRDAETGELIIKVVNAQAEEAVTAIDLGRRANVGRTAHVTTLTGDPEAVNGETERPIAPRESTFRGVDHRFTYTFPPHSVTFLRVPTR